MTRGIHPAFIRPRLLYLAELILRGREPFAVTADAADAFVFDACRLRQRELGPAIRDLSVKPEYEP